ALRVSGGVAWRKGGADASGLGFFFSSRGRHTRSKRDWSSDVCSSDLIGTETETIRIGAGAVLLPYYKPFRVAETYNLLATLFPRSEERRVGKECRSGCGR